VASCQALFLFYTLCLYLNVVPITMPGMLEKDPQSVINVRYGSVMASTAPLFAALLIFVVWRQMEHRRTLSLVLLAPLFLPDPLPPASREPVNEQFTHNLFYTEAVRNQSFWMPPFVVIAEKFKADMSGHGDSAGLVATNTRILHVVVWASG